LLAKGVRCSGRAGSSSSFEALMRENKALQEAAGFHFTGSFVSAGKGFLGGGWGLSSVLRERGDLLGTGGGVGGISFCCVGLRSDCQNCRKESTSKVIGTFVLSF